MMPLLLLAGMALLTGCILIYLASPNQRWRHTALRAQPTRGLASALLVLALVLLCECLSVLSASFIFVVGTMALLVLLPYLAALKVLLQKQRSPHHG